MRLAYRCRLEKEIPSFGILNTIDLPVVSGFLRRGVLDHFSGNQRGRQESCQEQETYFHILPSVYMVRTTLKGFLSDVEIQFLRIVVVAENFRKAAPGNEHMKNTLWIFVGKPVGDFLLDHLDRQP